MKNLLKNKKVKRGIFAVAGAIIVAAAFFTYNVFAGMLSISISGTYHYDMANEIIDLTNKERANVGSSSLEVDYELTQIAKIRARESALYFSHTRPNGEICTQSKYEGISKYVDGENLAGGYSTASANIEGWMESDSHKRNILSRYFSSIGVACYETENGGMFCAQIFSVKKSSDKKVLTGDEKKSHELVKFDSQYLGKISVSDLSTVDRTLYIGQTYTVTGLRIQNTGWKNGYLYTSVDNSNATFKSSNTKVATIDKNGTITAISKGETTISATMAGKSASYTVTVLTTDDKITSIGLDITSLSLKIGEEKKLTPSVKPKTVKTNNFTWKSLDENVATVDENGKVTAVGEGRTEITVTTFNGKTTRCMVTVEKEKIYVTDIYLPNYITNMVVGETASVTVKVTPSNTTEELTYKSSNTKVATIDKNGKITAVGAGEADITVSSKYLSETFTVQVSKKIEQEQPSTPKVIPITDLSINCSNITLKIGETFKIQGKVTPDNTTESKEISFGCSTSNCYRIATITRDGTITAVSAGEVEFTAHAGSKTSTCKVKVIATQEVESLSIPFAPSNLHPNEVRQIQVIVNPNTSSVVNSLTWTSSDVNVLTVSNGVIFTHNPGEATITVSAPNGVKASITLKVSE